MWTQLESIKSDKLIHEFVKISKLAKSDPLSQTIQLSINRADYIYNHSDDQFKLVEINTLASGLGAISDRINTIQ